MTTLISSDNRQLTIIPIDSNSKVFLFNAKYFDEVCAIGNLKLVQYFMDNLCLNELTKSIESIESPNKKQMTEKLMNIAESGIINIESGFVSAMISNQQNVADYLFEKIPNDHIVNPICILLSKNETDAIIRTLQMIKDKSCLDMKTIYHYAIKFNNIILLNYLNDNFTVPINDLTNNFLSGFVHKFNEITTETPKTFEWLMEHGGVEYFNDKIDKHDHKDMFSDHNFRYAIGDGVEFTDVLLDIIQKYLSKERFVKLIAVIISIWVQSNIIVDNCFKLQKYGMTNEIAIKLCSSGYFEQSVKRLRFMIQCGYQATERDFVSIFLRIDRMSDSDKFEKVMNFFKEQNIDISKFSKQNVTQIIKHAVQHFDLNTNMLINSIVSYQQYFPQDEYVKSDFPVESLAHNNDHFNELVSWFTSMNYLIKKSTIRSCFSTATIYQNYAYIEYAFQNKMIDAEFIEKQLKEKDFLQERQFMLLPLLKQFE
jgi:hypothetical protein